MNALIRSTWTIALTIAASAALAQQRSTITLDGSSTVFPPSEAVAEEFQKSTRGATRVTVGISGTGGGFKKFCRGETDISNASRPILKEEMDACRQAGIQYFELPIAFDALTVAVSPQNRILDCISVAELKRIWEPSAQGTVMSWRQVNPSWPDRKLSLYGAGADSGTFDYFTEAIVGKAKSSRGDYTASEDDNVLVQGIENDVNALGYIPFAYYAPNADKLKALGIDEGKGAGCVKPSLENVLNGSYSPLSRPLFIYVNRKSAERPEVKRFVEFYLTEGPELVKEVGYLPLAPDAYQLALDRFRGGEVGTGFRGVPEVGLPVGELLKRKPVH
jgi:phosphate transport system substrate-binding protein